jgi:hypothetical protein
VSFILGVLENNCGFGKLLLAHATCRQWAYVGIWHFYRTLKTCSIWFQETVQIAIQFRIRLLSHPCATIWCSPPSTVVEKVLPSHWLRWAHSWTSAEGCQSHNIIIDWWRQCNYVRISELLIRCHSHWSYPHHFAHCILLPHPSSPLLQRSTWIPPRTKMEIHQPHSLQREQRWVGTAYTLSQSS